MNILNAICLAVDQAAECEAAIPDGLSSLVKAEDGLLHLDFHGHNISPVVVMLLMHELHVEANKSGYEIHTPDALPTVYLGDKETCACPDSYTFILRQK